VGFIPWGGGKRRQKASVPSGGEKRPTNLEFEEILISFTAGEKFYSVKVVEGDFGIKSGCQGRKAVL